MALYRLINKRLLMSKNENRHGFYGWLANFLELKSRWLISGTLVITLLLLFPLFLLPPTEIASDNPTGSNVVKLHEEISQKFPYEIYSIPFIVEDKNGDMLTQQSLFELYQKSETLRSSNLKPYLYTRHNESTGTTTVGLYTIADAVHTTLLMSSNGLVDLSNATDDQVKLAVNNVLNNPATDFLERSLSVKATYYQDENGNKLFRSPALFFLVEADRESIVTAYPASMGEEYSDELAIEHFGRDTQEVLRGQEANYQLWGLAIDLNLEIRDEGRISSPMIGAAIIIILIIITFIFRSFFLTLISAIGLAMVIIWLKGFSNLVGLDSSIILDLIVPIAVLVLGIDYTIHAVFRYREEKAKDNMPRLALGRSTYRVGSALVLAMLTTTIAFGANASSGIESVIGFSIAASIAILASLIILGLFVPTIVMLKDLRKNKEHIETRQQRDGIDKRSLLGGITSWFANKWYLTLPIIFIVTIAAVIGWINLDTRLDPQDAFDSKSDLVISLDKADEHIAQKAGEPAILYIKGNFANLESLKAMSSVITAMEDDQHVARRTSDGKPDTTFMLREYLATVVNNAYIIKQVKTASGVLVTDIDGDQLPDSAAQLSAIYDYITEKGIPFDELTMIYSPQRIRETFFHDKTDEDEDATLIFIGVPGTREQAIVKASAEELNNDLETALADVDGITFYGLTGEAYIRDAQFSAITESLNRSLLIAVFACLFLLLIVFRSIRYAVVTLIPVLLVAGWLYGFMYLVGYHLNLLTATIAAISIGVGIDFSIHFTMRFRQELVKYQDKKKAIYETARSTGVALFGTAISTAAGFAVIAFAPMPMFASFGVLTAMMIVLSFIMALFALPSLLLVFIPSVK
jgi:predicted RND superfamily exporter protein